MRYDAADLARAWLAVAVAAGSDKDSPLTFRTVAIEEYLHGVRLVSTDRRLLLTAWVSELHEDAAEPDIAELPSRTVIATDSAARGGSMLRHLLSLVNQHGIHYVEGMVEVEIHFDVRIPAGQNVPATLDGMDPTYCVLDSKDVERVYLPVLESRYVDWRLTCDAYAPATSGEMYSDPDLLERIAKAAKYAPGPVLWLFGGARRSSRITFTKSWPRVSGIVMPTRSDDDRATEDDE